MLNETITENIIRQKFQPYHMNGFIVEQRSSENSRINKLLQHASKKGEGKGYPDFIIQSETDSDFLMIVECKASIQKHKSPTLNHFADYAVDGALLYSSYLAKEFDVIALGVSGQKVDSLLADSFLQLKTYQEPIPFINTLLDLPDYQAKYTYKEETKKQKFESLLGYTKELNQILHSHKIRESDRSLLLSGILIALEHNVFKNGFTKYETAEQLSDGLVNSIAQQLQKASIPELKIKTLKHAYSFIKTNATLVKDKTFFVNLIKNVDKKVNSFAKTYKFFDIFGEFYIEFLRYANNDKALGIVLTPKHITELFCKLTDITKDSIVFDNCCGTGGFLISAMRDMIGLSNNNEKTKRIKEKQIIGIEYQDSIFPLACSNMIIHGDGKTNIINDDCFNDQYGEKKDSEGKIIKNGEKIIKYINEKFKPTVGMLNPPFKTDKNDTEELEFVSNNLEALKPNGICAAILPMQCAVAQKGTKMVLKNQLLKRHTLEAVMSMPEDLFHNSKVSVVTCILVITAHKPHPDCKKTWLGYWRNDGFVKTKGQGRVDLENVWKSKEKEWLTAFVNRKTIRGLSTMMELTANDEWCIEAYMETDYSQITSKIFKQSAKTYLSYRLLNDLLDFEIIKPALPKKTDANLILLTDIFDVYNGLASSQVKVKDNPESLNDIRYIRPSRTYIGTIAGYVDRMMVDGKHIYPDNTIYVSTDGQGSHSFSYLSSFEFIPNSNVSVLIPKREMTIQESIYYAICITINRYRYSYGRKPKGYRLKGLFIPNCPPSFVYNDVFSEIFDDWKKVIK